MKPIMFLAIVAIAGLGFPGSAIACSNLTKAGERMKREREERYLSKESDKTVRGVWHADNNERNEENDYRATGYIEVLKGKRTIRYRVSISGEVNCGFPYYYLEDGDIGRFYLKRDDYPDEDDINDGYIDDYDYVHFKSLKRKED